MYTMFLVNQSFWYTILSGIPFFLVYHSFW
jgi:hypothetical protein